MSDKRRAKTPRAPLVVGLGELIWDMLPGGKRLGGAPSNFAYIARLLGNESAVASRVGDDALGREALDALGRMGVAAEYVQVDAGHPTGTVGVVIGERGEPHFSVNENSAWDYVEMSPAWGRLAAAADVVCFGTLGQRRPEARETIKRFLALTRPGPSGSSTRTCGTRSSPPRCYQRHSPRRTWSSSTSRSCPRPRRC